jgi:hypothetical protein
MIRRGVWLAAGFGLGVAAATRARRHVDRATAAPARVAARLADDVAGALADGRDEMHAREARLRAVLAAPPKPKRVEDPQR